MSTQNDDEIATAIRDLLTSIGAHTSDSGQEEVATDQRIRQFKDTFDARIEAEIPNSEVEHKLLEVKMEAARRAVLRDHESGNTALQEFLNLAATPDSEGVKRELDPSRALRRAQGRGRHWWCRFGIGFLLIMTLGWLLVPLGQGYLPQWCETLLPSLTFGMAGPAALFAVIHVRGLRERRPDDLQPEALASAEPEAFRKAGNPAPMRRGRRALDVIVGFSLLWTSIPILVAATVGIRATSSGPALVRRPRVGAGGRVIHLYDFRTRDSTGRRTRIGALLQESGLETLPRLWNLLRGDVTLLGPPAEHPAVAEAYPDQYRWVFAYRPGIAGPLWDRHIGPDADLSGGSDARRYYLESVVPHRATVNRAFYDGLSAIGTVRLMARMLFTSNSFTTHIAMEYGEQRSPSAEPSASKPIPKGEQCQVNQHHLSLMVWQ